MSIPVLFIDTCSILDIMRDPTREDARPHELQAAIDVLNAAEAGHVECLMAEQVAIEFTEHDMHIQQEAIGKLEKFRSQVSRVNDLVTIYGAPNIVDISHFDDHVTRARIIVGRWLAQLKIVAPSDQAPAKAFARMNAMKAPARQGKDSSKDCLIYETVLEKVWALRRDGLTAPVVFLSSNTREYLSESKVLKPDISTEFSSPNLVYAANMSVAKYTLGL